MAPNLRSSSHARSNDSRPSTPATRTTSATSSFTESTRPRKQRRTGRASRVGTDPLQDTPVSNQPRSNQHGTDALDDASGLLVPGLNAEWPEPPMRAPAPSYKDTPWSGVSAEHNPVLQTMRPLGALPSAADLRKAGLIPSKPNTPVIAAMDEPQQALNGDKSDEIPQTPLTPAEEQAPKPASPKPTVEDDLAAFAVLPMPNSTDVDMEKLRTAVENALRAASEDDNRPVVRALLHLWGKCSSDSFSLSILDGICQGNPGPREISAFQSVMREAWMEILSEQKAANEPDALQTLGRVRSPSSVSSLSSAKSLDAETFAPVAASGASASRSRKGKRSRNVTQKKNTNAEPSTRRSMFPSGDSQRKRALEDAELTAEALQAKRTRLQKSLPSIVASESGVRSSLTSQASSALSSPGPITAGASLPTSGGAGRNRMERSESLATSDAGDNRRLTPSLTDNESHDNNDFCRNCNGSGRLLCCDGCVNSFHFSCLNPPLDPANPPEGDWYCPKCSVRRPMKMLLGCFDKLSQRDFALPSRIRDFYAGVRTGDDGKYEEVAPIPRINPRAARGSRWGRYDDPFLLRTVDSKGKLIVCSKCGRTTNGRYPIIHCDYCPCAFHLDCLDPPMANPPVQRPGSDRLHHTWMCPNHIWHDLYRIVKDEEGYDTVKRIRRPKNPRLVDVDVLPDEEEDERLEEQEEEGVMYRVSEKGIKLDFLARVKRDNETVAMKKAAASRYFEYATTKFDELISEAHAFYASQKPAIAEDTATAILNSRTVAEREAAANLIAFAQSHQVSSKVENGRISLLIDQLKANAPDTIPSAEDEIASLRTLQDLIEQRIKVLNLQSGNTESPGAQPASTEQSTASIERD